MLQRAIRFLSRSTIPIRILQQDPRKKFVEKAFFHHPEISKTVETLPPSKQTPIRMAAITPETINHMARNRGWHVPKEGSKSYTTIQSYLSGSTHLDAAVKQIVGAFDEADSSQSQESFKWDLWFSVLHSSRLIPYHDEAAHEKLVSLVKAIQTLPGPDASDLEEKWASLPWFGAATRESYNDAPLDDGPTLDSAAVLTEAAAWANFNYFLARITAAGIHDFAVFHAIWALRAALEADISDLYQFDARVPAASAWILGAGKDIYERKVDLTPKQRNAGNPAKGGALWEGKAEFSEARWAFWKERFGVVKGLEGLKPETKKAAEEAFAAMEKVESD